MEIKGGDVVVMLSDGVSGSTEDSPWLPELLSGRLDGDLSEHAEAILNMARRHSTTPDDMTVAILRIVRI